MFKNISKYMLLFISTLFAFIKVNAATIEVSSGEASANTQDKSVNLDIKDDNLKDFCKLTFELSLSGTTEADMEFIPKPGVSSYYHKSGDLITFSFRDEEATDAKCDGSFTAGTIGTIKYNTTVDFNSNFTITPVNVKFYKIDKETNEETEFDINDKEVEVKSGIIRYVAPKSNDASLKSLSVSQGKLNPEFDPEVLEYSVDVLDTINTIRLSALANFNKAKVSGTESKTLEMGQNKFEIEVTAEDGTTKRVYTVNVNRGKPDEPSSYIKSLKINNVGVKLSPEFDKMNNKYTVNVGTDIKELDIKYELEDSNAKVDINGNENFVLGENKITIRVTASDESEFQDYTILVYVNEESSVIDVSDEPKKELVTKKKANIWLIVAIALGAILLIVGSALVLFKKKKTNKNNAKQNVLEDLPKTTMTTEEKPKPLFDDDRTTQYDEKSFISKLSNIDDDLEETKEFNFKDFN